MAARTAALLCAVVLAGGLPQPGATARSRPGPTEAALPVPDRIAVLYREATAASARFEHAHRKADRQRSAVARTQRAVSRGKKRLRRQHLQLGIVARSQYQQGGWSPGTQLLTSRSPDSLLEKLRAQRQGDRAFARLLRATRTTQHRLERNSALGRTVLRRLKANEARQERAKHTVEVRLALAKRRLHRMRAARVARAVGPVTRTAPAPPAVAVPAVMPAAAPGGCAYSPPSGNRAKSAGSGKQWVTPVSDYVLSAGFASSGKRWAHSHTGQDFAVPTGTPVHAVGKGTVVSTSCGDAFGNQIVIRHPGGYYTQYAHLSRIHVRRGQEVATGELIGLSGSTGNSTGPHLHFEVRVTPNMGSGVDPVRWLRERGVRV
ncbi:MULTISPECIES: M23 family metallopeptidase [unclassified Streptomyces]|uniref:M23 family metallopeptidase n=1 Tax=unclassified Streptomyces TaxID=2593676 RepID=UPI002DDAF93A|nr:MULTISPECIES: M23 family metallopeptidase [unclassified Streptomyces]